MFMVIFSWYNDILKSSVLGICRSQLSAAQEHTSDGILFSNIRDQIDVGAAPPFEWELRRDVCFHCAANSQSEGKMKNWLQNNVNDSHLNI